MTDEPTTDEPTTDEPTTDAAPSRSDQLGGNSFGPPHRVVEPDAWSTTLAELKADGYTYFDWLSAVDETDGVRLVAHLLRRDPWDHLLIATFLAAGASAPSVTDVFAGAAWHERETHEMFGQEFIGHLGGDDAPEPLLLPDGFEGHPLRKDFVLASRVIKAWPGAKEPGESDGDSKGEAKSPGRRRMKPPGVPDDWLQEPADE
jgi:NADH-quinone oxidoreductase subunit C